MLNTDEAKAVAIQVWERLNANPGYSYGRAAFMKMVEQEFNKAAVARMERVSQPVPTPSAA
ncbi:hypothetical protein JT55_07520 [Rhodovulum sp. NI22]|nr:hypothetical protein JT55_07520 [Rhodovulum sp. NI22]